MYYAVYDGIKYYYIISSKDRFDKLIAIGISEKKEDCLKMIEEHAAAKVWSKYYYVFQERIL